ncbi:hypothetical protein [Bordetella flabilis]|uniref:Uncharacterized protein n=2 Tax=Bordetella flabilis TaxID=463014 RepID=A0A193G9Z1_9BORD|nr:hypothetical protein [Bordetella flabilis]ANN76448.1 hypothetical protein BAU07_04345 [Bordetella flabilis]
MIRDALLKRFTQTLPYASEIFGVYQPLLGWKAKSALDRLHKGLYGEHASVLDRLRPKFKSRYILQVNQDHFLEDIKPFLTADREPTPRHDTILMRELARRLPPPEDYDPAIWDDLLDPAKLDDILQNPVRDWYVAWYAQNWQAVREAYRGDSRPAIDWVDAQATRESATAGILASLRAEGLHPILHELFYGKPAQALTELLAPLAYEDPFDVIDPKKDLDRVGLSPIGIVHLFRQYFFEFDTFLGSPVGHIWISPGSTVELVEVSTRRVYTERVTEEFAESIVKTESATTTQDELSEAVKTDNRSETKFGANVKGEQKWVWGTTNQSASFDMSATQQTAREQAHKRMRQQSDKLATEIRKNYKSTLRVITETTDTSSKRYVLTNNSKQLVNYELRRKMRQVGVQVQDIGTYLCWQTYVDEPGAQLGIAELVHIAKTPDAEPQHPEALARPQPLPVDVSIEIPFVQTSDDRGDMDEAYRNGREVDSDLNEGDRETIQADFRQVVSPPQPGYYLDPNILFDKGGADVELSVRDLTQADPDSATPITEVSFVVHLDYVNFKGNSPIRIGAKLNWLPRRALIEQVETDNAQRAKEFTEQKAELNRKEYLSAARDRIKLASKISPRRYEDLREEERIVVYRALIQRMLTKGIPIKDNATRHAVSELLDSIFDVDKMLYFVAPEWWKPRAHYGQYLAAQPGPAAALPITQTGFHPLGKVKPPSTALSRDSLVSWGGAHSRREDNYYITEDSLPARLGASLGWLLQLDGDDLRNAFLNAPWVKAVIPIRPGKNKAALNWLKQVEGMNGIGPTDMYAGSEPDLQGKTLLQALEILAQKVSDKQTDSGKVGQYPPQETDDDNKVSATPVDKVFEHGFYPLQGGFRATPTATDPQHPDGSFEVFDQWLEIVPTDQIVAVEVQYDPRTGRQLDPTPPPPSPPDE